MQTYCQRSVSVVLLRNRLFPFFYVRNAVKCSTTRHQSGEPMNRPLWPNHLTYSEYSGPRWIGYS